MQRFVAHRWPALAPAALTAAALWACGESGTEPVAPTHTIGVTLSSATLSLHQGQSGSVPVSIARQGGFTGPVALVVEGVPAGVEARFDSSTLPQGASTTELAIAVAGSAVPGAYSLVARASATGVADATATLALAVTDAPAVALALAPDSVSVQGGSSATTTLNVARTNFAGAVALTMAGAPEGLTVAPGNATVADSTTLTISADRSLEPGTRAVTVTGTASGVPDASVTLTVTSTAAPTVSLSLTPDSVSVDGGGETTTSLSVARVNFDDPVEISVTGAPENLTVVPANTLVADSTTLTISADRSLQPGTHAVTVTAAASGVPDASATLVVTSAPAPTIALSLSSASLSLQGGSSIATTLAVARTNFTDAVQLSVSGAPSGLTVILEATAVADSETTITVSADATLGPGTYVVTVTGSAPGVLDATVTVTVTVTPSLSLWLEQHPSVAQHVVWETSAGASAYLQWSDDEKAELSSTFDATLRGVVELDGVPTNLVASSLADGDYPRTVLSAQAARALYLATIAHSLALELTGALPWSVLSYSDDELRTLFDGRSLFAWRVNVLGSGVVGYVVVGWVLPAPPAFAYEFMTSGPLRATKRETLAGFIDWTRRNGAHFTGGFNAAGMEAHWKYRGVAPLTRILGKTNNALHPFDLLRAWFPGCHGSNHALIALFRAVNIPVEYVIAAGHATPYFPTEGIYLNHGDDLYSGYGQITPLDEQQRPEHIIPSSEYTIDQATWTAWLDPALDFATRQANISRRMVDLAFAYLPHKVLDNRCRDRTAGTAKQESQVYTYGGADGIYSIAELDAISLWERLDAEIEELEGCSNVPGT